MPANAGLTCLAALLQEQQDAQNETGRQMNAFEVCCICLLGLCMPAIPCCPDCDSDLLEYCTYHQLRPRTMHKLHFQHHMCLVNPTSTLLLQLINAALDISAIFEAREDVVSRHTRFTSKASVAALVKGIEAAAARLGATSQQRGPTKCASLLTCMSCLCQGWT